MLSGWVVREGGALAPFCLRGMEKANKVRLRERDRELGEPSGP